MITIIKCNLGLPIRKKLKKTAVPTVNLPHAKKKMDDSQQIERSDRLLKRQRHKEVETFLNVSLPQSLSLPSDSNSQVSTSQVCDEVGSEEIKSIMSDEKLSLELKYNELLEKYNELETQHQLLKNTTGKKIKLLNDQLRHYNSVNRKKKKQML
jgi:hypothetical protein